LPVILILPERLSTNRCDPIHRLPSGFSVSYYLVYFEVDYFKVDYLSRDFWTTELFGQHN